MFRPRKYKQNNAIKGKLVCIAGRRNYEILSLYVACFNHEAAIVMDHFIKELIQSYATYKSTVGKGSQVPLMHHDKGIVGSLTLIWVIPKECSLGISALQRHAEVMGGNSIFFFGCSFHNCYVECMTAVMTHVFKPRHLILLIFWTSN